MRRLVLPGVPAALHSDSEQVYVPAYASKRHRCGSHSSLLHHPHRGLSVGGWETCRLREQLPGEGGVSAPSSPSTTDLLRHEVGPPLLRLADPRPNSEEVHT